MPSRLRQYIAIQLVPSACSRRRPTGRPVRAVEHADVVEPEEAALEDVVAFGVLAVHPPREVDQQLLEHALEELAVAAAVDLLLDLVDADRRPRVHRRVDVAERPLVGRDLAVGMHVPLAREQEELLLREVGIDHRERESSGTPCPTPRTTGTPTCRASTARRAADMCHHAWLRPLLARFRRRRSGGIAVEPALDHVAVVLLAPQHAGERLALHVAHVVGNVERRDALVERVGLRLPRARTSRRTARPNGCAQRARRRSGAGGRPTVSPGADRERVVRRGLGADARRIHRVLLAVDEDTRGRRP